MNYDPAYGFNKFKALMENPEQARQNPMMVVSALMGLMAPPFAQKMDSAFAQFGGQFPGLGALFGQRPQMPGQPQMPQTSGQMPLPYAPQQPGQPLTGQPQMPQTGGQIPLPMFSGLTPFDNREPFRGFYRQSSYGGGGGYGGGQNYFQRALYGGGGGMGGEGAGGGNAIYRMFGPRGSGY